jgi:hypothetical protein
MWIHMRKVSLAVACRSYEANSTGSASGVGAEPSGNLYSGLGPEVEAAPEAAGTNVANNVNNINKVKNFCLTVASPLFYKDVYG